MTKGFIRISRELFDHPAYISAPDSHRNILMTLMHKACFKEMEIDDHGKKVLLKPGEICCTIRQISEWTKSPQTTVVRALKRFLSRSILVQKAEHKAEHKKSIFTISTTYLLQEGGTTSGTKTEQERNTKQESNNLTSSSIRGKATEKKQIALPPVSYETKEDVKRFLALGLESGFAFAEKSVIIWLKKHKIDYMISHFYDMIARKNLPNNFHTWFTTALKNNYVGEKDRVEYHRKWISDVKDIYNLNWIKINKTDCRFTHDLFKETLKFDLVDFKAIVLAKVNALKEKVA